jgi:predicted N-acyltransferase
MDIHWHNSIDQIDPVQWDRLAAPLGTPLLEWQWLHFLEDSGSVAPAHGWHPCHLTLWDGEQLIAAAPLYIKTHSEGEFVFDHWWAKLSDDHGVRYYPKLVGMSPLTPAVGYRFLMDDTLKPSAIIPKMMAAIDHLCRSMELSCFQINFVDPDWHAGAFPPDLLLPWHHQSFLWKNPGLIDFADYLKPFKSSQRRNIRREIRQMDRQGIEIRPLTGSEISQDMAMLMFRYYLKTNAQYGPWAARYLNADFFDKIFEHLRHRLLLMAAYHVSNGTTPIALSMLLRKGSHLIGRYWGSAKQIKDLHFNMCFYAPIRWAIANGIQTIDPGAGSPHKIYRGFKAVANTSLHRFYDPRLKVIFRRLIDDVNQMEHSNIRSLNAQLPFAQKESKTLG